MIFFFTYTSSKLEVLNNNDYCSKSVASSLRFSIQFFKTQLKIPRNRGATFFKRLVEIPTNIHYTLAVFVINCPKNMRLDLFWWQPNGQLALWVNQKSYTRWLDKKNIYEVLGYYLGQSGLQRKKIPAAINKQLFEVVFSTFCGRTRNFELKTNIF